MYRYLPFAESLRSDELGAYRSFGIKAADGDGRGIMSVSDVSLDRDFVAELCRKCTDCGLDPVHLQDVIDDNI